MAGRHPAPHDVLSAAPGGARLAVRLTPRARREGIEGVVQEPDGRAALKVAVDAPPVDGKANTALIALVAASLGVSKTAVRVAAGASGRRKLLMVEGDLAQLRDRLALALEGIAGQT